MAREVPAVTSTPQSCQTKNKREYHFQKFTSCGEFQDWQAAGDYERNILTITPFYSCTCCDGENPQNIVENSGVICTWWESPPQTIGH